jgi:hypothetical protein
MESMKSLLDAVIKYQDVMDLGFAEPGVGERYLDVLDALEQANENNEEFLSKFNFTFSKDVQRDFDNLQKFISAMTKEEA